MNERELLTQCYPLVVHAARLAPDMYADLKERIDTALSAPAPAKQEQAEAGNQLVTARVRWHRQRGASGQSCPTPAMCESFDAGFAAALLTRQSEAQQEEGLVTEINLDAEAWAQIKEAARVSLWMPPNYMMNDWVSDVCGFLHGCEDPLSAQSGKEGK